MTVLALTDRPRIVTSVSAASWSLASHALKSAEPILSPGFFDANFVMSSGNRPRRIDCRDHPVRLSSDCTQGIASLRFHVAFTHSYLRDFALHSVQDIFGDDSGE